MALTLGPLVISLPRLLLLLGIVAGLFVAWRIRRRHGVDPEPLLWLSLLAGLLAARLAYIATHWEFFQAQPLDMLKFWQGGFMPLAGGIAAVLVAFLLAHRKALKPALVALPLFTGLLVWGGSSWIVHTLERTAHDRQVDLAVQTLDGQPRMLSDFRGKPTVVNVWATWCPPCRREMPMFAASAAANPQVNFVFLNQGEGADAVRAYLAQENLALPNVLLDVFGHSAQQLGARGLPTTFFLDADGRLVSVQVGEISAPRLADQLQRLDATD